MNNIKTLVFKYFCGYVFFFLFLLSICLEVELFVLVFYSPWLLKSLAGLSNSCFGKA